MVMKNYTFISFLSTIYLFCSLHLFSQNKEIATFSRQWNPSSSNWEMQDSSSIAYDSKGNISSIIFLAGDEPFPGKFTQYSKLEHTYSSSNKLVLSNSFTWNTSLSKWDTVSRSVKSYDQNDNLILDFTDNYSNGWLKVLKYVYNYDNANNLTKEESFLWDTKLNAYVYNDLSRKTDYVYNGNNELLVKTDYLYDTTAIAFKGVHKFNYTNALGKTVLILHQVWDGQSKWYDMDRDSLIYSNGLLVENYHRYRHQGGMDMWGFVYKEVYLNNSFGKIDEHTTLYWDSNTKSFTLDNNTNKEWFVYDQFQNLTKISSKRYDVQTQSYLFLSEVYKYYNYANLGLNNLNTKGINVYPNPFINDFRITSTNANVEFVNLSGQTINVEKTVNGDLIEFQTSQLPKGVYFLIDNETTKSYKLIKE